MQLDKRPTSFYQFLHLITSILFHAHFFFLINSFSLLLFFCVVLYCIVLYCIVLHCIILYCIALYYIVLYCIVLYSRLIYRIISYPVLSYHILSCLRGSRILNKGGTGKWKEENEIRSWRLRRLELTFEILTDESVSCIIFEILIKIIASHCSNEMSRTVIECTLQSSGRRSFWSKYQ